ncbi:MAG: hypothetical protein NTZ51_04660 [Proteobacteria bacterium]|nr:hypothetical protein [Pseudomonadota bacterium]
MSSDLILQDFPRKFFSAEFIGRRGDFQRHNNMVIGLRHDPGSVRIVHGAGSFHKPPAKGM